jgi:hypothetical protein
VTDRIVRADQVLRGTIPVQKQIAVEELGGTLTKANGTVKRVVVVHQNPIQEANRYVLFLSPSQQPVGDQFDGNRYVITGVWAGSFQLANGHVRLSDGDGRALRALGGMSEAELLSAVQGGISAAGR